MDNPALSLLHQEDFSELLASTAAARGQAIACAGRFTESIGNRTGRDDTAARDHWIELARVAKPRRNR